MTGWSILDPLVSIAIVAVILIGTWGLLKDSVNLALDAAPPSVDVAAVKAAFLALPGVSAVHDLHVWGLSTTETALTAHLSTTGPTAPCFWPRLRSSPAAASHIGHTTLQLESGALPDCPDC
jgi:cobalt-zinc-cadmium efflux system protein